MKKLFLIGVLALGLISTAQAANEGIKVHGHWQFDIYNKDGSFDRKVEFENALDSTEGSLFLNRLLAGQISVGYWEVSVEANGQICSTATVTGIYCVMVESGFNTNPHGILTTSISNGNFILKGSFVASFSSQLQSVSTANFYCPSTEIPRSCDSLSQNYGYYVFTTKNLTTAVDVQAGQTVNVTVTISFS